MEYTLIDNQSKLSIYLKEMQLARQIAIDTEFIRTNSYYPKLSLLQLTYKAKSSLIIDCLSVDINDILDILYQDKIVKIFHCARQDLEIFYNIKKTLPKNIFDTQVAVLALNLPSNLSYEKLVKHFLDVDLDKSLKNSSWLKRPLSKLQLQYAGNDSAYLLDLYHTIQQQLLQKNRQEWLKEEFIKLEDTSMYEDKIYYDLMRLSVDSSLNHNLSLLKALLQWRETQAQLLDVPKNSVLHLNTIKDIVKSNISTLAELHSLIGETYSYQNDILQIITNYDKPLIKLDIKLPLTTQQKNMQILLKIILTHCCNMHNVNEHIVANKEDLTQLALLGDKAPVMALNGWRLEVFGQVALDFMRGNKSLSIKNNNFILS